MTTGQPIRVPSDRNKYDNEFMENLRLQIELNDRNLQANRLYQTTGQLPPSTQMADTRSITEKLADIEGLKRSIVSDLKPIADSTFAYSVINGVINSPFNVNNSLFRYLAQNAPQIAIQLSKVYKFGIAGDENDVALLVEFIEDAYKKTNNSFQSIKAFMNYSESSTGNVQSTSLDNLQKEIDNGIYSLQTLKQEKPLTPDIGSRVERILYILSYLRRVLPSSQEMINLMKQNSISQFNSENFDDNVLLLVKDIPKPSTIGLLVGQVKKGMKRNSDSIVNEALQKLLGLFSKFLPSELGGNASPAQLDFMKNLLQQTRKNDYMTEKLQEVNSVKRLQQLNKEQQMDAKAQRVYIVNPQTDPVYTTSVQQPPPLGQQQPPIYESPIFPTYEDISSGKAQPSGEQIQEVEQPQEYETIYEHLFPQESASVTPPETENLKPVQQKTRNTYIYDRLNDMTISELDDLFNHLFMVEEDDDTSDNDKMNMIYDALSARGADYDPRDTHRKNRLGIAGLGLKKKGKGIRGRGINNVKHRKIRGHGLEDESVFFFDSSTEQKIPIDVTPKTNVSFIPQIEGERKQQFYYPEKKIYEADVKGNFDFFRPKYENVVRNEGLDLKEGYAYVNSKKYPKYDYQGVSIGEYFFPTDDTHKFKKQTIPSGNTPYTEVNPLFPQNEFYNEIQERSEVFDKLSQLKYDTRDAYIAKTINESNDTKKLKEVFDSLKGRDKYNALTIPQMKDAIYNLGNFSDAFTIKVNDYSDNYIINRYRQLRHNYPEIREMKKEIIKGLQNLPKYNPNSYVQYLTNMAKKFNSMVPPNIFSPFTPEFLYKESQYYDPRKNQKLLKQDKTSINYLTNLYLPNEPEFKNYEDYLTSLKPKSSKERMMEVLGLKETVKPKSLNEHLLEKMSSNESYDMKQIQEMNIPDLYEAYSSIFGVEPPYYKREIGGIRRDLTIKEIKEQLYNKLRGNSKKTPYKDDRKNDDKLYSEAIYKWRKNTEPKKLQKLLTTELTKKPKIDMITNPYEVENAYERLKAYYLTNPPYQLPDNFKLKEEKDLKRIEYEPLYRIFDDLVTASEMKKKYNITVENFLQSEELKPLVKNIRGKYKISKNKPPLSQRSQSEIDEFIAPYLKIPPTKGFLSSVDKPLESKKNTRSSSPKKSNSTSSYDKSGNQTGAAESKSDDIPSTTTSIKLEMQRKKEKEKGIKERFNKGRGIRSDYREFGINKINHKKLDDGILTIRRQSNINIPDMPSKRISRKLQKIIKHISGGGIPEHNDLNDLDDGEKDYLHKLVSKSNLQDRLSVPAPSKDQEEKDFHQFEVMKGEIMSGNDSKELVQKFKALILKLSKQNVLPKTEVSELLQDLISLGY
jgi:hypothetical protein